MAKKVSTAPGLVDAAVAYSEGPLRRAKIGRWENNFVPIAFCLVYKLERPTNSELPDSNVQSKHDYGASKIVQPNTRESEGKCLPKK